MFYISYFLWTIPGREHANNEHSWNKNNVFEGVKKKFMNG